MKTRKDTQVRTIEVIPPCIITPRLMVGVQIGTPPAWVSVGNGPRNGEGRTVYGVWIDLPDGTEHEVTELRSGCGGGSERDGLADLLCFLGAATESYAYRIRQGEDFDPDGDSSEHLFPPAVVQWAAENADEISLLAMDIEEPDRAGR